MAIKAGCLDFGQSKVSSKEIFSTGGINTYVQSCKAFIRDGGVDKEIGAHLVLDDSDAGKFYIWLQRGDGSTTNVSGDSAIPCTPTITIANHYKDATYKSFPTICFTPDSTKLKLILLYTANDLYVKAVVYSISYSNLNTTAVTSTTVANALGLYGRSYVLGNKLYFNAGSFTTALHPTPPVNKPIYMASINTSDWTIGSAAQVKTDSMAIGYSIKSSTFSVDGYSMQSWWWNTTTNTASVKSDGVTWNDSNDAYEMYDIRGCSWDRAVGLGTSTLYIMKRVTVAPPEVGLYTYPVTYPNLSQFSSLTVDASDNAYFCAFDSGTSKVGVYKAVIDWSGGTATIAKMTQFGDVRSYAWFSDWNGWMWKQAGLTKHTGGTITD